MKRKALFLIGGVAIAMAAIGYLDGQPPGGKKAAKAR